VNYQNRISLDLEFGKLKDVMSWCRDNCSGDWFVNDHDLNLYAYEQDRKYSKNHYVFEFDNEHDLITFSLKFK
jgi:hypothetical protein